MKTSPLWEYFEIIGDYVALCNICQVRLSFKATTSNLKKHLDKQHPSVSKAGVPLTRPVVITIDSNLSGVGRGKKNSPVWKFYEDLGEYKALCNLCQAQICFRTTTNLIKHLARKHPLALMHKNNAANSTNDDDSNKTVDSENTSVQNIEYDDQQSDEDSAMLDTVQNDNENNDETTENIDIIGENTSDDAKFIRPSFKLWDHFEKIGDYHALCKLCNAHLSFRTSTTNLRRHFDRKHATDMPDNYDEDEISNSGSKIERNENTSEQNMEHEEIENDTTLLTSEQIKDCNSINESTVSQTPVKSSRRKISKIWEYFEEIGDYLVTCNICSARLSFKTSISNLKKHLDRQHPMDRSNSVDRVSPISFSNNSEISQSSWEKNLEYDNKITKNYDTQREEQNEEYINRKQQIDEKIFQLFIYDFQPLSILKDKGFRELISFSHPEYIIPSQQYFLNKMLPEVYNNCKSKLTLHMQMEQESLCISTDLWTPSANDSYMAVTGHYIDGNFCHKTILLDCILLNVSRIRIRPANELRRVLEEWYLFDRVHTAVTNNEDIFKTAIENNLGWNHINCLSNSLDKIIENIFQRKEILLIFEKIESIVSLFEKSNEAWEKLKQCQEQSGKVPEKLTYEISKRWISKFYIMEKVVKLQEEIKYALENLDSVVNMNLYEWEVCKNICEILKPCEEAATIMDNQKYMLASVVIPMIRGIRKYIEKLSEKNYVPLSETFRQDLLTELKQKYQDLETDKTLALCTFLDPRYKLYFEDPSTPNSTKQYAIQLVTVIISDNESQNEDSGEEDPITTSKSSLWDDYINTMKYVRRRGTADFRSVLEVQKYMEDTTIGLKDDPLKWWRDRAVIYPNLSKLVIKYFNTVVTIVPTQKLFSTATNTLKEHRTHLGHKKLQQLLFLNQNFSIFKEKNQIL